MEDHIPVTGSTTPERSATSPAVPHNDLSGADLAASSERLSRFERPPPLLGHLEQHQSTSKLQSEYHPSQGELSIRKRP